MYGREINTAINLAFEAYPEIKSTDNFKDFQKDLSSTENRIAYSRSKYNEAVRNYNAHIRGFFNSMFLNSETFPKKEPFKQTEGSEKAVEVKF
jgi:LemA protein